MPGPVRGLLLALILALLSCGTGSTVSGEVPAQPGTVTAPWSTVVVTGSTVNLRAGPGTAYAVVGRAVAGDTLRVTGGTDDWYRVYDPTRSLFAWIYAALTTGTELP